MELEAYTDVVKMIAPSYRQYITPHFKQTTLSFLKNLSNKELNTYAYKIIVDSKNHRFAFIYKLNVESNTAIIIRNNGCIESLRGQNEQITVKEIVQYLVTNPDSNKLELMDRIISTMPGKTVDDQIDNFIDDPIPILYPS